MPGRTSPLPCGSPRSASPRWRSCRRIIEAVYVSPTAVFMDERSESAQVIIGNAGDTPEEATVELRFGFPDVDSAGTPFVRLVDDPGTGVSVGGRLDPRLPPARAARAEVAAGRAAAGASRRANLPDGEYWTRLIVTGRGAPMPDRGRGQRGEGGRQPC